MYNNTNFDIDKSYEMFDSSQKPEIGVTEEINQYLYALEVWGQPKIVQQTICQVEQQTEYFIDDLYDVYDQFVPEIRNKTEELEKIVDEINKNKCFMSKGNGVYKFIECLKDQKESIKHLSQQILFALQQQLQQRLVYSNQKYMNFRSLDKLKITFDLLFYQDFRKMQSIIQKYLQLDFKQLRKKTNKYIMDCQKVYVCQKPVLKQIPSVIEKNSSAKNKKFIKNNRTI